MTQLFNYDKKVVFIEEPFAGVAQPVEQLICNQQVAGSSPIASSSRGGVPEWLKGADCKSVGDAFGGSNPPPSTIQLDGPFCWRGGNSSVGRASAFQAERRGFESRFPLQYIFGASSFWMCAYINGKPLRGVFIRPMIFESAHVAQSVEHFLGKEEVHRFDPGRGLHKGPHSLLGKDRY